MQFKQSSISNQTEKHLFDVC